MYAKGPRCGAPQQTREVGGDAREGNAGVLAHRDAPPRVTDGVRVLPVLG